MLNHSLTEGRPSSSMSGRRILRTMLRPMLAAWHWIDLYRQRQDLSELDDHLLADLGLTRAQVRRESAKWPWQA